MTLSTLRAWLILLAGNMGLVGWAVGAREYHTLWAPIVVEVVGVVWFYWWLEVDAPGAKERGVTEEAVALLHEVLDSGLQDWCCEDADCDCPDCRATRWLEHHGV